MLAKRPVTRAGWICLALDAWLIGGSLLTLSWSLALAQAAARPRAPSVAHAALSLAYPLLDIALVSMVLALHFRRSRGQPRRGEHRDRRPRPDGDVRRAVHLAAAARRLPLGPVARRRLVRRFAAARVRPLGGAPTATHGRRGAHARGAGYVPRPRPGPTGHGPLQEGGPAGIRQPAHRRFARALTPYLAAAVCTLGILYNVLNGRSVDRVVLLTGCTVVLALVVRQGIMLLDNIALTQELAQKENHFRSLVQGSSDVIMIAAPTASCATSARPPPGSTDGTPRSSSGTELASLIHPEDLGCVVHEVRRFLAASPPRNPPPASSAASGRGGGDWLNVESTVNRHHGGLIFNSRDVTERVRLQAQLQHNAEHDPLTDLPNRALFTRRVRQALSGRRAGDRGTAVLFIDLDGFKAVNDTPRPPGRRRAAGPGRPQAPGRRAARGHRRPARRRRVRRPHRRRRHPRPRRARVPDPGDRRPAAAHPLPAVPHRRQRGPGGRLHRRRLRRARPHARAT